MNNATRISTKVAYEEQSAEIKRIKIEVDSYKVSNVIQKYPEDWLYKVNFRLINF